MNNYDMIIKAIDDVLTRIYSAINDYLGNILNAPSTINRIIKYYSICIPDNIDSNARYILFKDIIIRTYVIEEPQLN